MQSARKKSPQIFTTHEHVKAAYRQLFKRSRKKGDALLRILPQNLEGMLELSSNVAGNQSRNDDIRLGKVIHYHLLDAEGAVAGNSENREMYRTIWHQHIGEIEGSPFWHSDGQTTIKRTEAFIRVFRLAIVSMARSLREMSQLENTDQDILHIALGQHMAGGFPGAPTTLGTPATLSAPGLAFINELFGAENISVEGSLPVELL